jgi:hypothetical protein
MRSAFPNGTARFVEISQEHPQNELLIQWHLE